MEHTDLVQVIASRKKAWKVEELAELLSCHKNSIYQQIQAGKLPALRVGMMLRLNPSTTAAWLKARQTT